MRRGVSSTTVADEKRERAVKDNIPALSELDIPIVYDDGNDDDIYPT